MVHGEIRKCHEVLGEIAPLEHLRSTRGAENAATAYSSRLP